MFVGESNEFPEGCGLESYQDWEVFYLQSGLKHNTSMCALQLLSVNVYDLFFFPFKVLSYHATAPLEEANKLKVFS